VNICSSPVEQQVLEQPNRERDCGGRAQRDPVDQARHRPRVQGHVEQDGGAFTKESRQE
jgi:hypothetical protein